MTIKIKFNAILAILLMIVSSCATEDSSDSVTDIDGNVYNSVKIGTQVWMVQNLKTTKYRNGESIGTTAPSNKNITQENEPKYQWAYNGDEGYVSKYGRLYTWYAVNDSRNIAPIGWHIPTDAEWKILEEYVTANLGSTSSVAKALASKTNWTYISTTPGAIGNDLTKNNRSGFTGLPSGYRFGNGTFDDIGNGGSWWSSTQSNTNFAWYRTLYCLDNTLHSYNYDKQYGYSVRCIRDN